MLNENWKCSIMKSRNNLDLESNQRKLNETHNRMSLLPELNVQIPSRNKNQDTLKDTSTIIIKRSYADVYINRKSKR